jgi:WD40 repeat protein
LEGALRLSAHVLAVAPDQLPAQLLGRLLDQKSPRIAFFLTQMTMAQRGPWLRPLTRSLTAPGGPLVRTLAGHTEGVQAVALSADGRRALSGSYDTTLKVWDVDAGEPVAAFFGEGRITSVQLAADRKTVVAGDASGAVHLLRLENAD